MCLLHELLDWDCDGIRCTARSHLDPNNPLRLDGHLAPIHAIEYASQACALHAALTRADTGETAPRSLLAAVTQVELGPDYLDLLPAPLEISAWRALGTGAGAIYRFSVSSGGRMVAQGRLTVMAAGVVST